MTSTLSSLAKGAVVEHWHFRADGQHRHYATQSGVGCLIRRRIGQYPLHLLRSLNQWAKVVARRLWRLLLELRRRSPRGQGPVHAEPRRVKMWKRLLSLL